MRKGRFSKPAAEIALRYGESVSFDWRLYRYDIAGSIAHAAALARAGTITAAERRKIETGLRAIQNEIESGKFKWDRSLEDVHMNIEAVLAKRIDTTGAKLHTARSRNDQIALDLRLYVKAEIAEVSLRVRDLQRALLNLAEKHVDVVMSGYTHLQRAQPIALSHYLLGQMEAFERDAERLRDCLIRTDVLPLGSGALAGSTLVLDRERIARELGFARVSQNSIDAVSDRSRHDRHASLAVERRLDHLEHARIRAYRIRRRIFHGLEFDAAEEKSRHRRADSRQNGQALRKFDVHPHDDESASVILQP